MRTNWAESVGKMAGNTHLMWPFHSAVGSPQLDTSAGSIDERPGAANKAVEVMIEESHDGMSDDNEPTIIQIDIISTVITGCTS